MRKKWIVPALAGIMLILFGGHRIATCFRSCFPEQLQLSLFTMIIPYGILLPICYLFLRPMNKIPFGEPHPLSNRNILKIAIIQTGLSLPVLGAFNILMMIISKQAVPDMAENVRSHIFFYMFLLLIFNPVVEEFLFRKLILQRLRPLGDKNALWISAVFFALPHLFSQGLPQLGYTFMLGLVWGTIALRCNRLKECVLLHAFSNAYGMFLPLLLLESSKGTVLLIVLNLAMIFTGIFLTLKRCKKVKEEAQQYCTMSTPK